jgi:hypothetical protein
MDAVEHDHVEVDVEVQREAEVFHQGDDAGARPGRSGQASTADEIALDGTRDDVEGIRAEGAVMRLFNGVRTVYCTATRC